MWLDSSVGRALHRYRRGHVFESRSGLNVFFVAGDPEEPATLISTLLLQTHARQLFSLALTHLVSFAAVIRVVTQRSSPLKLWAPKLYHAQNMSHLAEIYRLFPRRITAGFVIPIYNSVGVFLRNVNSSMS